MSPEGRKIRLPGSLRFRLFAAFSLFTFLISVAFTSLWIVQNIRLSRTSSTEKAELLARHLSTQIRLPLYAGDKGTVSTHAAEIARQKGVHRVCVYDPSGLLVSEVSLSGESVKGDSINAEADVSSGEFGPSVDQVMGGVSGETLSIGKVRVEMNNSELNNQIFSLIVTSAFTGFIFWVFFICIAYLIVRLATKSLEPLVNGLKAIHAGDYSAKIACIGDDELSIAASTINELAQTLLLREAENARLQQELIDSMKSEVRDERRSIMAKLIQTNRMTSLGLLVSGAAHEINTPNGAMRLAGQKFGRVWNDAVPILERVAADEGDFVLGGINYKHARIEVANSLELISRCTGRIDQVLKDLRDYSLGAQSRVLETIEINRVVSDALSIITAHRQMENILVDRQLPEDIPLVMGNRFQLKQVMTNLLLNAIQAIPEGGSGSIAIITQIDDKNREVTVTVSDNGEGIPDDIKGKLMEPFFSTRIEKGGSGLGLYISNYIINEHNGSLSFESTAGKGTVFTVRLPAVL